MSDDYTPSTDELIARARQQTRGITDPSMRERLIIDLADALESVRAEERERIARLLDTQRDKWAATSAVGHTAAFEGAARIAREGA
ncbi:hypothetical protein JN535_08525 [Cellulosimicrobium cellulans]|uniref:hypothetical protein n=1 Tax=Cellulosimicrobium cellulans TaxID=1710 RepID=UPI001962A28A|nr:hypothetical protein [Cellulosimicrobium cellulans]MBN0040210.1 hypothetical protein [Cellulosimicrobium cellulans]